ncbi:RICIN domain-containing protein [Kitasatospora sp. NPDC056327]|uniref:RICIN domain-containing protein n=1 Tax=Kitasatospora sp. NPDC056327 TaxID=3345785 RepID=UPI0035D728E9
MSLSRRARATLLALAAALAGALPLAAPGTALAGGVQPTPPYFTLRNLATGKCLEVADRRTDDGAPVRQWTCHGGPNQQWGIGYAGHGLVSRLSGTCLDVPGGSTVWGTQPVQWQCHLGTNQEWTVPGHGRPELDYLSALGLVLDVPGGSTADGTPVVLWGANGGANQLWRAS